MEQSSQDMRYRRRKNEFTIFVDASFQNGVFKMPLIDPPRQMTSEQEFELQKQNRIIQ